MDQNQEQKQDETQTQTQEKKQDETQTQTLEDEVQLLKQSLPKASFRGTDLLTKYQEFWVLHNGPQLSNILNFQRHFNARDTDIVITSVPKTGSTWLRSLLFSIMNRANQPNLENHPLVKNHPNELVFNLEAIYGNVFDYPRVIHLNELPSPRLFFTHLPYESLPESIKASKCRLLYITRNPLDTIVSLWYFIISMMKKKLGDNYQPPCFEDFSEDFYNGRFVYGPFFEHVLGFWKKSLERPEKVLFLTYEDLKDDTVVELKRLAEFLGVPFSTEEEDKGIIKEIIELCSIKSLKGMEVNKNGVLNKIFEKKSFFRKGEVGDWKNHFKTEMANKMIELMEKKLKGTGLSFRLLPRNDVEVAIE
ncbi:cytosolic sulfotransferase 5-like [Silene latifolia]|uniref:cytosolic sulfotransferase 5-like n=1 Tax=Silene latifolia TaxID=37657 RepID=UPI003D773942